MNSLEKKHYPLLLISILAVALCGIAYELIIGAVSSYLLGNSVYQFSITIGFFMFAMGVGSYFSKFLSSNLLEKFVIIEILVAIVGGVSGFTLFLAFSWVNSLYSIIMYFMIFIIGFLVGLEIPLLTRILAEKEGTSWSISSVMSFDYIGALIGSIAFPLLLLPHLGLIKSSFAIGLINILTALVTLIFFRKQFKNHKRLLSISFLSLVVLVFCLAIGSRLSSFAEHHLYFDQVIYEKQSMYQKITVTRARGTKEHRLFIDGHIQFSERDEYRYHEALIHPIMSFNGSRRNVLILGGGDGLAARELLKYPDVEHIDLVDIDAEMTDFGKNFNPLRKLNQDSLHNPKVAIHNVDAFNFINQPGRLYDRVIIDLPDPHNEALNKLYSKEFYTMISRRMTGKGFLVSQSSSPFFSRNTFWCIEKTLDKVFHNTFSYHVFIPSFGDWGFNIAAKEPINKEFSFNSSFRFINSDVMRAASVFSPDIERIDTPVNTIMHPILYSLYLQDLKK